MEDIILINKNYFKNIDNQDKAYLLGFLYGDGSINSNRECGINLKRSDKDFLTMIGNIFGKKPFDTFSNINEKTYEMCRLSLSSVELVKDLSYLGLFKNKTYIDDCSKLWNNISFDLKTHFIRGYFDADGCIYIDKKNNPHIEFCSYTKSILSFISNYLNEFLGIKKSKITRGDGVYRIRYGGSKIALSIGNMFYFNAKLYLKRKKDRFLNITVKNDLGYIGISKSKNESYKVKISKHSQPSTYIGTFNSLKEALEVHENIALKINGNTNGVYQNGKLVFWKFEKIK